MYKEIEKQLDKITDGLKSELLNAHAIDESGNAIDAKKFNKIIDEKISQCYKVLEQTEDNGVTTNKYGANIAYTRIHILEEMKKHGMFNPENAWISREERKERAAQEAKPNKKESFNEGLKKLFKKIGARFTPPSNSNDKNR